MYKTRAAVGTSAAAQSPPTTLGAHNVLNIRAVRPSRLDLSLASHPPASLLVGSPRVARLHRENLLLGPTTHLRVMASPIRTSSNTTLIQTPLILRKPGLTFSTFLIHTRSKFAFNLTYRADYMLLLGSPLWPN